MPIRNGLTSQLMSACIRRDQVPGREVNNLQTAEAGGRFYRR